MTFYLSVLLAIYFILLMALGFTVFKFDQTFRDMSKEIKFLRGSIDIFEEETTHQRRALRDLSKISEKYLCNYNERIKEFYRTVTELRNKHSNLQTRLDEHTKSEKSVLDAVDGYTAKISARIDELNSVKPRKDMPIGLLIRGEDDPSGRPQYFVLRPFQRIFKFNGEYGVEERVDIGMNIEPYLGEGIGGSVDPKDVIPAPDIPGKRGKMTEKCNENV